MNKQKEEQEIISVDEIITILNNYRIGKKPLAKLLGWGETTILRYVEGDIPTNEYSDKLKMILKNPGYFYDVLTSNKENITKVAYNKCKKAVLKQLLQSKISVVAQYIINKRNGNISMYELQEYLYYAQNFSMALYEEALFQEEYSAEDEMIHYPSIYEDYKTRKMDVLELEFDALTLTEMRLIDEVMVAFEWYGIAMFRSLLKSELREMKISRDQYSRKVVTKEVMTQYFKNLMEVYHIRKSKDISKYPDAKFYELRRA